MEVELASVLGGGSNKPLQVAETLQEGGGVRRAGGIDSDN